MIQDTSLEAYEQEIEQAARKAATTGNVEDLRKYLRLRRNSQERCKKYNFPIDSRQ